jgi:hypothetical protein
LVNFGIIVVLDHGPPELSPILINDIWISVSNTPSQLSLTAEDSRQTEVFVNIAFYLYRCVVMGLSQHLLVIDMFSVLLSRKVIDQKMYHIQRKVKQSEIPSRRTMRAVAKRALG